MADVYKVPVAKKPNTFKFQIEGDDEVFEVPVIDNLPMGFLSRIQSAATKAQSGNRRKKAEGSSELLSAFMDVLDAYAPGVTEVVDSVSLEGLLTAWTEAGESLGE